MKDRGGIYRAAAAGCLSVSHSGSPTFIEPSTHQMGVGQGR